MPKRHERGFARHGLVGSEMHQRGVGGLIYGYPGLLTT